MMATKSKIIKLEDLIPSTTDKSDLVSKNDESISKEPAEVIPRGKPKSGRIWKSERQRFSSIRKTKGKRQSFEKKQALRAELKRIKDLSKELKENTKTEIESRKERRRENIKRRAENEKKAEIVQVIKNTQKLKKMKKSQLRNIEKRDTTVVHKK